MSEIDAEKIWKKHLKYEDGVDSDAKLRKASSFSKAEPWVLGISSPSKPTQIRSNVMVYHGWANPHDLNVAKEIVKKNKAISLKELQTQLFTMLDKSVVSYPYIWWVQHSGAKKRAIHEDVNGIVFVKLENKWRLAYPISILGGLVGAQYAGNAEDVPPNSYFVLWDNEQDARKYY